MAYNQSLQVDARVEVGFTNSSSISIPVALRRGGVEADQKDENSMACEPIGPFFFMYRFSRKLLLQTQTDSDTSTELLQAADKSSAYLQCVHVRSA